MNVGPPEVSRFTNSTRLVSHCLLWPPFEDTTPHVAPESKHPLSYTLLQPPSTCCVCDCSVGMTIVPDGWEAPHVRPTVSALWQVGVRVFGLLSLVSIGLVGRSAGAES